MAIGPWWILTYGACAAWFASEGMSSNAKNMLKILQHISFVSSAAAVFSRISKCLSAPG